MTNIGCDIDGATLLLEHGHVLGESFKAPIDAIAQHIQRHAFDLREVAHGQFTVLRTTRCNGEATVANDGGGHAHGGRGAHIRVPGDLGIEMGMRIDDARHQGQALGIDGFFGLGL